MNLGIREKDLKGDPPSSPAERPMAPSPDADEEPISASRRSSGELWAGGQVISQGVGDLQGRPKGSPLFPDEDAGIYKFNENSHCNENIFSSRVEHKTPARTATAFETTAC
jgi:hypothetical protein